jgi:hypothetical protein
LDISRETAHQLILTAFEGVKTAVESGTTPLSSEATLRLLFTWNLGRLLGYSQEYRFDLEWQAFDEIDSKDTFLDLLVWTDPDYKIAIEFKLPKRSPRGRNTNQTQTRAKICRDISRLSYLVRNGLNGVRLGFFIAAAGEPAYLVQRNQRVNTHYRVHDGAEYPAGSVLKPGTPPNGIARSLEFPNHPVRFDWRGFQNRGKRAEINGEFAWLDPIQIQG